MPFCDLLWLLSRAGSLLVLEQYLVLFDCVWGNWVERDGLLVPRCISGSTYSNNLRMYTKIIE